MKKYLIILILFIAGAQAYGQSSEHKMLNNRGMFILGHILPGIEQKWAEDKPLLGCSLMAGTVGFGGYAIYKQLKIHDYKIQLDGNPSESLFWEEQISKAEKARNISLIGLGAVELVNIITLWTGHNSPIQLAYYPNFDAYVITYA